MSFGLSPHFFVCLKDDFQDRCRESEEVALFEELENPYLDARERLTPGKIYPVVHVDNNGRQVTVLDDRGCPWETFTGLFKFADL